MSVSSASSTPRSSGPKTSGSKTSGAKTSGAKTSGAKTSAQKSAAPKETKAPVDPAKSEQTRKAAAQRDQQVKERVNAEADKTKAEAAKRGLGAALADRHARALSVDGATNNLRNADKSLTQAKQSVKEAQTRANGWLAGATEKSQLKSAQDGQKLAQQRFDRATRDLNDAEAAARFRGDKVPPRPTMQNDPSRGAPTVSVDRGPRVGVNVQVGPARVDLSVGGSGVDVSTNTTAKLPLGRLGPVRFSATPGVDQNGTGSLTLSGQAGPMSGNITVDDKGNLTPSLSAGRDLSVGLGVPGVDVSVFIRPDIEAQ